MRTSVLPALDPVARERFREAGRIAAQARLLAISRILPGAKLESVMLEVEDFIRAQGGEMAFPAQTSRNHIAAHYCPRPGDPMVYEAEDVVKVDIGVHVDGYVADNAQSKYLGEDPRLHRMVEASAAGLRAAIQTAGPGVMIRTISAAIEAAITAHGFRPVWNLTGHGVGRWTVHCAPSVPASPESRQKDVLVPGMVIAIEPFATDGGGEVHETGRSEIFMLEREPRKLKDVDPEVWAAIQAMNGLPFARRTFGALPAAAVDGTLGRLRRIGCLAEFPPLADPDLSARVAQTEHTLLVTEDGIEVITADC
ncbi:MAG: type II methionyl aminopeptidase [Planctomycetota bacterium]|nr:type II methionyl aminopeptidase [Planctomycetota bacterium]